MYQEQEKRKTVELKLTETQQFMLDFSNSYYEGSKEGQAALLQQREIPAVVARIINELKKEEGFTYADAYGTLRLTEEILKLESQFIGLAVNSSIQLQESE